MASFRGTPLLMKRLINSFNRHPTPYSWVIAIVAILIVLGLTSYFKPFKPFVDFLQYTLLDSIIIIGSLTVLVFLFWAGLGLVQIYLFKQPRVFLPTLEIAEGLENMKEINLLPVFFKAEMGRIGNSLKNPMPLWKAEAEVVPCTCLTEDDPITKLRETVAEPTVGKGLKIDLRPVLNFIQEKFYSIVIKGMVRLDAGCLSVDLIVKDRSHKATKILKSSTDREISCDLSGQVQEIASDLAYKITAYISVYKREKIDSDVLDKKARLLRVKIEGLEEAQKKNWNVALARFRRMALQQAKYDEEDPVTFYLQGIACIQMGKRIEARKMFRRTIELNPSYYRGYYGLALALYPEELKRCQELCRTALKIQKRYADAESLLGVVKQRLSDGKDRQLLKESIKHYKRALRSTKDPIVKSKILANLGIAYIYKWDVSTLFKKRHALKSSRKYLGMAMDLDPINDHPIMEMGVILLTTGDYKGAIEHAEKYLCSHFESPELHSVIALGLYLANPGQSDKPKILDHLIAVEVADALSSKNIFNGIINRAGIKEKLKLKEGSFYEFYELIKKKNDSKLMEQLDEMRDKLVHKLRNSGQEWTLWDEVYGFIEKKEDETLRSLAGWNFLKATVMASILDIIPNDQNPDKYIKAIEKMHARYQAIPWVSRGIARGYSLKKEKDKAVFWARKSVKANPNDYQAYRILGYTLTGPGTLRDAANALVRAGKELENTVYLTDAALNFYAAGAYEDAIEVCELVAELSPGSRPDIKAFSHLFRAITYYELGDCALALGEIKKIKEVVGSSSKTEKSSANLIRCQIYAFCYEAHFYAERYANLATAYELMKKSEALLEKYKKDLEKANRYKETKAAVADTRGWVLFHMSFQEKNEPKKGFLINNAFKSLEEAELIDPDDRDILYHMAMIQKLVGEKEAAVKRLRRIICMDPKSPWALKAKKELWKFAEDHMIFTGKK